jgi:uncharacterized membrane protein YeaQ/YmgE (transglycosylase-associated protein family)
MVSDLVIFAVIGLFVGSAARLFYAGRQPARVLGTLILGMVGSVLGGLITWAVWPVVEGEIHSWALLVSFLGAVLVLVSWAAWSYARRVSGPA